MLVAIGALVLFFYLYYAITNANEKAKQIFTKPFKMTVTDILKMEHEMAEQWQNIPNIKILNVKRIDENDSEVIFEYDIKDTKWIFWNMFQYGKILSQKEFQIQLDKFNKNTNNATAY